ncbi:MAG: cob(I)yrinic acid a,c-diamide adenosyltransferase [Desulfobacterales bacterium]|nr:cob(I)yrinic acid a,c-diamide adenosyltransferase [Desulfobacterales bacterium]
MQGYVQVYTGNGKGKTTAALGLAVRAAGAGLKVFIAQFLKTGDYSEIKALKRFSENITIEQYGCGRFIKGNPSEEDIAAACKGLERIKAVMESETYDVIILDEANVAVKYNLFPLQKLLDLIDAKPDGVELVITGRWADPKVIAKADLVTEMKEIRHYLKNGVSARTGIEK